MDTTRLADVLDRFEPSEAIAESVTSSISLPEHNTDRGREHRTLAL